MSNKNVLFAKLVLYVKKDIIWKKYLICKPIKKEIKNKMKDWNPKISKTNKIYL